MATRMQFLDCIQSLSLHIKTMVRQTQCPVQTNKRYQIGYFYDEHQRLSHKFLPLFFSTELMLAIHFLWLIPSISDDLYMI